MKAFEVEIPATLRKTMLVEAPDMDAACETAHELFSVLNDGSDEHYEQETLNICEVEK